MVGKTFEPSMKLLPQNLIIFSSLQFRNAELPMDISDVGNVRVESCSQFWKHKSPIVVSWLGNWISLSLVHLMNKLFENVVTLLLLMKTRYSISVHAVKHVSVNVSASLGIIAYIRPGGNIYIVHRSLLNIVPLIIA